MSLSHAGMFSADDDGGIVGRMNQKVRPLVDLIDGLRSVGIEKDVAIPQIAVMGDQSSGKSSVLEALSGVSFPRGVGLVTRCATELRMKRSRVIEGDKAWRAVVKLSWDREQPSCAGEVQTPEEIGEKITQLTDILLNFRGTSKTFESEHSIVIELQSHTMPDLTVIDLPGIVRTTVTGQDETVIADVNDLLDKYLHQDRTIILAVIPSNVDIATVDIIERASKADPEGKRTIAVLTKPDMIGDAAHQPVLETLRNRSKPLKLGYIMVKNRSQREIQDNVSLSNAKASELDFFSRHEDFGPLMKSSPELFGVDRLTERLTEILFNHIERCLPEMKNDLIKQVKEAREALNRLGKPIPVQIEGKREYFLKLCTAVREDLENAVKGTYSSTVLKDKKCRIIARLREEDGAEDTFVKTVYVDLKPEWTLDDVMSTVADLRGREVPGFANMEVFNYFVREYVSAWKDPLMDLLERTAVVLKDAGHEIVRFHTEDISHHLLSALSQVITDIVEDNLEQAKEVLQDLLENEGMPYTRNHYLFDTYNKFKQDDFCQTFDSFTNKKIEDSAWLWENFGKGALSKGESNEEQEAQDIIFMLEAYWKTSIKRFIDNGCQNVDRTAVRNIPQKFMLQVIQLATHKEELEKMVQEDEKVKGKRLDLQDKLKRLREAQTMLCAAAS